MNPDRLAASFRLRLRQVDGSHIGFVLIDIAGIVPVMIQHPGGERINSRLFTLGQSPLSMTEHMTFGKMSAGNVLLFLTFWPEAFSSFGKSWRIGC